MSIPSVSLQDSVEKVAKAMRENKCASVYVCYDSAVKEVSAAELFARIALCPEVSKMLTLGELLADRCQDNNDGTTNIESIGELLEKKYKNLEAIFDAVPTALLLLTEDYRVVRINESMRNLSGKAYEELIGGHICKALGCGECRQQDDQGFCNFIRPLEMSKRVGKAVHGAEIPISLGNDQSQGQIWFTVNVSPTVIGEDRFLVVMLDDISRRKRAEADLRQAKRETEQAKSEIERINKQLAISAEQSKAIADQAVIAEKTKSKFVAAVSHDIRTPMNAILGFAELLSETELNEEQLKYVSTIADNTRNLLSLLNDILDLSKLQAGKLAMEMNDFSLSKLLEGIESLLGCDARGKGLEFVIECGTDVPDFIRTDEARLRQCLMNIVGNAVKFTDQGHIHVITSLAEHETGKNLRFVIEDTGIGIPEDKQDTIFHSFSQTETGRQSKYNGTGLGLAITRSISEHLGGSVNVNSTEGKGSTFTLEIPLIRAEAGASVQNKSESSPKSPVQSDTISAKALVVEDAPPNQVLMKLVLEKMGMEVVIAENGQKGVEEACAEEFDIIFMDIQMPVLNGFEATRQIREKGIATPIVALTANAMKGDSEKCINAGCNEYLSKPIDRSKLQSIIQHLLANESDSPHQKIDTLKVQMDELAKLCSGKQINSSDKQEDDCHLDWAAALKYCGDEAVIRRIASSVCEDGPKTFEALRQAVEAKRSKDILLYAHKLRGNALTIGATELPAVCDKIEEMGREEKLEGVEQELEKARIEFDRLIEFLQSPKWVEISKRRAGTE